MRVFKDLDELAASVGESIGPTGWIDIAGPHRTLGPRTSSAGRCLRSRRHHVVSAISAIPVTTTILFWVGLMSDHDFFAMPSP